MVRFSRCALTIILVSAVIPASCAFADSISIFNTGANSTGTAAVATGLTDLHYTLISAPAGVPLNAITTSPNPAWTPNTSMADWISPGASGGTSWAPGTYIYQTTFSLAGDNVSTAQLSGFWSSDNDSCIDLNGVSTGDCVPFTAFANPPQAFSITSGFVAGTNTLDFVVDNGGGVYSPTGVFAKVSGTVSPIVSTTPEPSSWMLASTGLLGLAGMARRRLASR